MKRFAQIVCLCVLTFTLAGLPALAQVRSRIPPPRPNQPAPNPSSTPSAPSAPTSENAPSTAAQQSMSGSRSGVADDAFTWFEAVSTEALGQNNIPYSTVPRFVFLTWRSRRLGG